MAVEHVEIIERTESRLAAWWAAWKFVAILGLLLAGSVYLNVTQWADHRAYRKSEAARMEAAAMKAGLQVAAKIATAKPKDDANLIAAMNTVAAKVDALTKQKRPQPLPIQCAPGQVRMDAVNAGADR